MSKDEFFAFMPLLIYGIAVSELIMHWRDYLKKDRRYWPHLITGLLLLEFAFLSFYSLYDKLELLFIDYEHFLFKLTTPLVLLLTVSVYTPENDRNVKDYFKAQMPTLFSLLALFFALNMIQDFAFDFINLIRTIAIILSLMIALFKKPWLVYVFLIIRLGVFFLESAKPQLFIS